MRPPRAALAGLAALAACSDDVVVRPVIDTPAAGGEGAAFADLDSIELSVALEGEQEPLVSSIFRRGETLALSGVPYGENLVIHMVGRVNSAEVAYGRTCRFAVRAGEDPPEPHLYFARTVRWADAAVPPSAVRIGGAALASPSGNALYLGGVDASNTSVLGADRFDASTGRFEELATLTPRFDGAAANLGNGRSIVLGGVDASGQVLSTLDLISIDATPDRAVEAIEAPQLGSRFAPTLATLANGRVVAIGGLDGAGTPIRVAAEITGEGAGATIRMLGDAELATPRYGHTVTRLSDDLGAPLLVAGGRDAAGAAVAAAELYRPLVERFAPASDFSATMSVPRWDHTAVRLPDGSIVILGGRNASGPVTSVEIFTLSTGFFIQSTLPLGVGITDFSTTVLPDGRVLIAGGRDATGAAVSAASILRIDPLGGRIEIVNTDRLSFDRAGHEATLLCDGTVLLVGGTGEPSPAERYNPPSSGRR